MKNQYKVLLLILSLLCLVFVYNDHFIYKTPILKITNIETILVREENNGEIIYEQKVSGTIKNSKYKGKKITLTNKYSSSLVYDDKYEKGTELFVNLSKDGDSITSVVNIKRDKYITLLLIIFIDLILLIAKKKGLKTLISLFINIVITLFAIMIFRNNPFTINMLYLYFIVSIIFIVISLFITNGRSKKTTSAIISSIASLLISFGFSYLMLNIFIDEINIWGMEYIEMVQDYRNFFYVNVLICGLGAIMDIAITISSSLNELITKNPKIKRTNLLKSGKEISKDIIGTMTNVLLYTCYTSVIPIVILALKNNLNMSLMGALDFYGGVELIIILCSCIGIILTIPISLYISVYILCGNNKRRKAK